MENQKIAVITGVLGQGGSYLAEHLLDAGHKVIGTHRRSSNPNLENIESFKNHPSFELREDDITDYSSMCDLVKETQPYWFFNLAAQSHVHTSYKQPFLTTQVNYNAVINMLEAIRLYSKSTRFIHASTSERYGDCGTIVADENTPAHPVSPYAVAKVAAELCIDQYKKTYGLWATYFISFNYESPRRGVNFCTRKVSKYMGETFNVVNSLIDEYLYNKPGFISTENAYKKALDDGKISKLRMGNIASVRSWCHAACIMRGVYSMALLDKPDVFVFGKNEPTTVREFIQMCFYQMGITDWEYFVEIDPNLLRPSDVNYLAADASKAERILKWVPKISLKDIVKEMVNYDIEHCGIR